MPRVQGVHRVGHPFPAVAFRAAVFMVEQVRAGFAGLVQSVQDNGDFLQTIGPQGGKACVVEQARLVQECVIVARREKAALPAPPPPIGA